MYHGILIDQQFTESSFPQNFKVFAVKQDGSWKIYGIEVENEKLGRTINECRKMMKVGKWYCHFYNEEHIWIVFKDKLFEARNNKEAWEEILKYGEELGIPKEQLDFQPHTFEGEKDYFKS